MKTVWVETLYPFGPAIRIFKNRKEAMNSLGYIGDRDRKEAVKEIRRQVYNRQEGRCLYCPTLVSWDGSHMHEVIHRGRGGEISLQNCVILCASCHIGRSGEHGKRVPAFRQNKNAVPVQEKEKID